MVCQWFRGILREPAKFIFRRVFNIFRKSSGNMAAAMV
jgi:hypothetical protein